MPFTAVRLRPRRRAIARNLEAAGRIPSLTADMQMDMTALLQARREWNEADGRASDERLSVMAFVATAAVSALAEFPGLNATYTERTLLEWQTVNLGIAVDAPGGLVVPVIKQRPDPGRARHRLARCETWPSEPVTGSSAWRTSPEAPSRSATPEPLVLPCARRPFSTPRR